MFPLSFQLNFLIELLSQIFHFLLHLKLFTCEFCSPHTHKVTGTFLTKVTKAISYLIPFPEFSTADHSVLIGTIGPWFPWHFPLVTSFLCLSLDISCWPSLQTLYARLFRLCLGSWSYFSLYIPWGISIKATAEMIIYISTTPAHLYHMWCPELHTHYGAWHMHLEAPAALKTQTAF